MSDGENPDDARITPAARTFVIMATGASLAAFDLGFDLGAFENIGHRKIWAIWVLCTVALVSSFLFRDSDYHLGGRWRFVLTVPSLWLIADFFLVTESAAVVAVLLALSLAALPFGGYILIRLVAGDFVSLTPRLRGALVATAVSVFVVGWYVGDGHPRFLECRDFARSGEFVPDNCRR